jgi:hypothetical protein
MLVPILSQMNPFHILIPYFLKIHFNITLLFTLMSFEYCVSELKLCV